MSVVFTDSFTVGSDTNIDAYGDYEYRLGSGSLIQVDAGNNRVQQRSTGTDGLVRITNASVPSGNQKIACDQRSHTSNDSTANLACRISTSGNVDGWLFYINNQSNTTTFYSIVNSSFFSRDVDTPSIGQPTVAWFSVVGTGSSTVLRAQIDSETVHSYDDTTGEHDSGSPGIHMYATTADQAWLDNIEVDDLIYQPSKGSVTFAGFTPTVTVESSGITKSPTKGTVTFAGKTPTVTATADLTASPTKGAITFTGFAPTVGSDFVVGPTKGEVSFTGFTPATTVTENKSTSPTKGAVVFTGQTPTSSVTINKFASPTKGAVTFSGQTPTVGSDLIVSPTKGTVTFTGIAPTATVSVAGTASPTKGAITFTGFAPTVSTPLTVSPTKGSITFTGFAPTAQVSITTQPSKGEIAFTGVAPSISVTTNVLKSPSKGDIVFTGFAPTVTGGTAVAVSASRRAGGGFGRRRRRRTYLLPDRKIVVAYPEELAEILKLYNTTEEQLEADTQKELRQYPKNMRRKQRKRIAADAIPAPQIIAELDEENDIQFVLKEVARLLR